MKKFTPILLMIIIIVFYFPVSYCIYDKGMRDGKASCSELEHYSKSIWIENKDMNPEGKWTWNCERHPYADSGWININYWILNQDVYEINIQVSNMP